MTVTYAGFWKRFAAVFIDGIILVVLTGFLYDSEAVPQEPMSRASRGLINILIFWVYFAAMESSSLQATLGKTALRIKVTDVNGAGVSFATASGRYFGKYSGLVLAMFASNLPASDAVLLLTVFALCILPVAIVPFTAEKQGLHDMMARCLVVNK